MGKFRFISQEWKDHAPSDDAVSDVLNDIICSFRERGNTWPAGPKTSVPLKIGSSPLEEILPLLFLEVYEKRGGYDIVCHRGSWNEIRRALKLWKIPTSSTHLLKFVYREVILPYEREQNYYRLSDEDRAETDANDWPFELVGRLIGFPCDESVQGKLISRYYWGRIRSYDGVALEHLCLLDDGRLVRSIVRDANAAIGGSVDENSTIRSTPGVYRYDPSRKAFTQLEPPASWSRLQRAPDVLRAAPPAKARKVDHRVEMVCCVCGWQREVGKMLKCSVCGFLSHSYCYGISDETSTDTDGKRGFKCFFCAPSIAQAGSFGSFARDVGTAVLRVRSQNKWTDLRKKLGQTGPLAQFPSAASGPRSSAVETVQSSTSTITAATNYSSVQTRARRGLALDAAST